MHSKSAIHAGLPAIHAITDRNSCRRALSRRLFLYRPRQFIRSLPPLRGRCRVLPRRRGHTKKGFSKTCVPQTAPSGAARHLPRRGGYGSPASFRLPSRRPSGGNTCKHSLQFTRPQGCKSRARGNSFVPCLPYGGGVASCRDEGGTQRKVSQKRAPRRLPLPALRATSPVGEATGAPRPSVSPRAA